jgi:hypothetical protein
MNQVDALVGRAEQALAARRAALLRRFGWGGLDLACAVDPARRALAVRGEVVTARTLHAALADLRAVLPPRWTVDVRAARLAPPRARLALPPGVTRLWRTPDACLSEHAQTDSDLCTELLPGDGPLALLAAVGASALVEAGDGTVGWTRLAALASSPRETPSLPPRTYPLSHASSALSRALRRRLGAPYLLGGTTPAGFDCSGLVQRCVRAALGVVLPRHSTDQLALAATPAHPLGEPGDLLFLWREDESPCHVGVILAGSRPGARTLVHASSRRGRVIEEPLARALRRAAAVRHVELEQLLHTPRVPGGLTARE